MAEIFHFTDKESQRELDSKGEVASNEYHKKIAAWNLALKNNDKASQEMILEQVRGYLKAHSTNNDERASAYGLFLKSIGK